MVSFPRPAPCCSYLYKVSPFIHSMNSHSESIDVYLQTLDQLVASFAFQVPGALICRVMVSDRRRALGHHCAFIRRPVLPVRVLAVTSALGPGGRAGSTYELNK